MTLKFTSTTMAATWTTDAAMATKALTAMILSLASSIITTSTGVTVATT